MDRTEQDIITNPSTYTLIKLGNEIEDMPKTQVIKLFEFLGEKKPKETCQKFDMVLACKYMLQTKYYEQIFRKSIPDYVLERGKSQIELCK